MSNSLAAKLLLRLFVPAASALALTPWAGAQSLSQSQPDEDVSCIVLSESSLSTSIAAGIISRQGAAVVVTRYAWTLELAGPAGNQHVVIRAGHDPSIDCDVSVVQSHLYIPDSPVGTDVEVSTGAFVFASDGSGRLHQTADYIDLSVTVGDPNEEFDNPVSVGMAAAGTDIVWSGLGASETFRIEPAGGFVVSGVDHTISTEIVSFGAEGAHVYTVVESNGSRTEFLTETIETYGIVSADGAEVQNCDCGGFSSQLGCCTTACGTVANVSDVECNGQWIETCSYAQAESLLGTGAAGCNDTIEDPKETDDNCDMDGDIDPLGGGCNDGCGDSHPGGQPMMAEAPIDPISGRKLETATDVSVDLSGTDFVLTRRYRSVTDSNSTLVGNAWGMSVFSFLDVGDGGTPVLTVKALQGFAEFTWDSGALEGDGAWTTGGASDQTIVKAISKHDDGSPGYAVWRLTKPGAWQMDFHRIPDTNELDLDPVQPSADLEGLPYNRIDTAGNRWSFEYD